MATKKKVEQVAPEEKKASLADAAKTVKRVSGGPFAPRRDGDPFLPATRLEACLYMIATGEYIDGFDPITREERFLCAIAFGDTGLFPDPITREEVLLTGIAFRMSELLAE